MKATHTTNLLVVWVSTKKSPYSFEPHDPIHEIVPDTFKWTFPHQITIRKILMETCSQATLSYSVPYLILHLPFSGDSKL